GGPLPETAYAMRAPSKLVKKRFLPATWSKISTGPVRSRTRRTKVVTWRMTTRERERRYGQLHPLHQVRVSYRPQRNRAGNARGWDAGLADARAAGAAYPP